MKLNLQTMTSSPRLRVVGVIALLSTTAILAFGFLTPSNALVVYCAHDSIFSERILRDFERKTGIPLAIRFDTEATKSLGLVNLLRQEKKHPRCDVFWNNELLGMLDLQEAGLLEPYRGPGHQRIPAQFKDPDGFWTGFAGRLRVYILNTDKVRTTPEDLRRFEQDNPARMAVAKPLYGTTRTHYTTLWQRWGADRLVAWHRSMRERGLHEVQGNAMVKNIVAAGKCDFGWTDTDDLFVALDDGLPVEMLPVRLEDDSTICIPNTVAIIKGTRRLDDAQSLVDYLLSAKTELALASSPSRQIPLGNLEPGDVVPPEVDQLRDWAEQSVDLLALADARHECLQWLKSEYLK